MSILFNHDEAKNYIKNNKASILELVNKNGKALKYADDNLKNDREIVLAAVKKKLGGFRICT